ncbi:MAG: hypothetical protein V1875_04785 [Candidatus Altiarchaeota archaeon]
MAEKNGEPWLFRAAVSFIAGTCLILLFAAASLSTDWLYMNGASLDGICVNHFGETYRCSIAGWLLRLFSPFSCIPYALILYTALSVAIVLAKAASDRK